MREVERRPTWALRRFVMLQITNIDAFGIGVYTEAEIELESRGEPTDKKWQARFQRLGHFEIPEEFRYLRKRLEIPGWDRVTPKYKQKRFAQLEQERSVQLFLK